MAERHTQVSISRAEPPGRLASTLGEAAASVLSHLVEVVDREDRLESGTGRFRQDLAADKESRNRAAEDAVLRVLRMAADPVNYRILDELARSAQVSTVDLSQRVGLPRLAIEERVSDLVSAGLAAKVFSSGRIAGTDAGAALAEFIRGAVAAGSAGLGDGLRQRASGENDT